MGLPNRLSVNVSIQDRLLEAALTLVSIVPLTNGNSKPRDHSGRQGGNGLRPKTGVFGQRKRGREY
jgi:hypothetical protein